MFKYIFIAALVVNSCGIQAATKARVNEVYNTLKRLEKENIKLVIALHLAACNPNQTLTYNFKCGITQSEFEEIKHQAKELGLCDQSYFIDQQTANIIKAPVHTIYGMPDCPLIVEVCHPKSLFTWTGLIKIYGWLGGF